MVQPKENKGNIRKAVTDWLDQFSPFGVMTTDEDLMVTGWNQWMVSHSGRNADEVVGRQLLELYPDFVERRMDRYFRTALSGQNVVLSQRLHGYLIPMTPTDGKRSFSHMPQGAIISPLSAHGTVMGTISYIENVSERIEREKDLEEQITRLQEALNQVKTLKGLLPICSYCKKIRNDQGYWSQLESYFGEHADVDFSHGICPECLKKHYPEFDFDEDEE